jgi:hypothetical protein
MDSRLLERKRQLIRIFTVLSRTRTGRTAGCPRRPAGPARPLNDEVLSERALLPLIGGSNVLAVEQYRWFKHSLERQLAHGLTVLDQEWDIVGPDLECGP